jgi:hypothetical protein
MALQTGNAGIYVSGNITRFAELREAVLMNEIAFCVVARAERKTGAAWQAATRMGPTMSSLASGELMKCTGDDGV